MPPFFAQLAEVLLKVLHYQISRSSMDFEIRFDNLNNDSSASASPDNNKYDGDNNDGEYDDNDDQVNDLIKDFDKLEL